MERIFGKLHMINLFNNIKRNQTLTLFNLNKNVIKLKHTCKVECPNDSKYDLTCKVALITGGISGIGYSVASELLCAGIRHVAITGTDKCKGRESMNTLNNLHGYKKVSFYANDICNVSEIQETFKAVKENNKKIDIIVNCAGAFNGQSWEKEIVVNLLGIMRTTLLAYRFMGKDSEGKGGTIINLTGVQGLEPLPPAPTLSASYHGIVGFSRSFGDETHFSRTNLRVITLCTGFTKTDFLKRIKEKSLTEIMGSEFENLIKKSKIQNSSACGEAVLHVLKCGKSGSVWVCEGSNLYTLNIPDRSTYSKLVAQFL